MANFRHFVIMMFEENFYQTLCDVKKYVVKYGQPDVVPYFTAIHWQEKDGSIVLTEINFADDESNKFPDLFKNNLKDNSIQKVFSAAEADNIITYFRYLHSQKINVDSRSLISDLNICMYVPLFQPDIWEKAKVCLHFLNETKLKFVFDIIGIDLDLANLFCPDLQINDEVRTKSITLRSEIISFHHKLSNIPHFIIVSNYKKGGVSLNFNIDSFVAFLSEYSLLCIENYEGNNGSLFNPVLYNKDILALGFSVMNFDRYYFVEYLMNKAYIHVLKREDIGAKDVSMNFSLQKSQEILNDKVHVFADFYDEEVKSRLDQLTSPEKIIVEIEPILKEKMNSITADCEAFIVDKTMNIIVKRAVFSALLGKDDNLFENIPFTDSILEMRDLNHESMRVFIDANNALLDYESLKSDAVLSIGDTPVISPWEEIKTLRLQIFENKSYIKRLEDEINLLRKNIDNAYEIRKAHIVDDGWIDKKGNIYRLLPDKEFKPLNADYYTPHEPVSVNVDLREGFTDIKHQGQQGSCTAHSVASIFEYILKSNKAEITNLSESFLYYNARALAGSGNEDNGCSMHLAIESMGKYGICSEEVCPYDDEILFTDDNKPGEQAYEDAKLRKVEKALNIKVELKNIKSAIEDGYPVEFAAKLFSSFEDGYNGVILYPSAEEMKLAEGKEKNFHAMVICGYDDEKKLFIVRNSWGDNFGDKGYCYMPYSYITNTTLTWETGYIITDVINYNAKGVIKNKGIDFDDSDEQMRLAIKLNMLSEQKLILDDQIQLFRKQNDAYNRLLENIRRPINQKTINTATERRINRELKALEEERNAVSQYKFSELSANKKKTINNSFLASSIIVALTVLFYFLGLKLPGFSILGSGILCVLIFISYQYHRRKNIKRECEEKFKNICIQESWKKEELKNNKLKIFCAGRMLDAIATLNLKIENKYKFMLGFIDQLNTGYVNASVFVSELQPNDKAPFVSLIKNNKLDKYIQMNADEITEGISLCDIFNKETDFADEENFDEMIVVYDNAIKLSFYNKLNSIIRDFHIGRYLTEFVDYHYLEKAQPDILLPELQRKSEVFYQHLKAPDPNRRLFINLPEEIKEGWRKAADDNLSLPLSAPILSIDKIILTQMEELNLNEIL